MPPASSSSYASSSRSDSDMDNKLKRKFTDLDSGSSDGDSESSDAKPVKQHARKGGKKPNSPKKMSDASCRKDDSDVIMDDPEAEADDEDAKVLSHKEQRRLKKKQKLTAHEGADADANECEDESAANSKKTDSKSKKKKDKAKDKDALPRRQNSVWVGNLSFRTTPDTLRAFFDGVGEVTRVHMPMKSVPGAPKGAKGDNRGFAYVDFATPEAKTISITLSEKNLDGRRLLIKDGGDFTGRPAPSTATPAGVDGEPSVTASTGPSAGLPKAAQKILSGQKQPAGPCLFLGNLGFEATDASIREMFEGHAFALAEMRAKKERKKGSEGKKNKRKGKDDDLLGVVKESDEDGEEGEEEEEKVSVDVGIKKVRMGTFEDSGLCKGFAFVDFTSTVHATAALTNPRNHFLDGRKLVVEYASPDAARRGGYREKGVGGMNAAGRKTPKRSGENKYGDRRKRKTEEGMPEEGRDSGDASANTSARIKEGREDANGASRPKEKRQHPDEKSAKHKRPKPGAALALAQREKFAIVPSEGTRLKFN